MGLYDSLISVERRRGSNRGTMTTLEAADSDRSRVIYCASLRRMQRKTQVFPLENNAAVRSRLTHSLEVAHVGRYLTDTILAKARQQNLVGSWGIDAERAIAMGLIVETACLLHDIGNPPFGHFGELAISRWFAQKRQQLLMHSDAEASRLYDDFLNFDGNPQGFRLIAVLAGVDGATGLNLTLTQLAATVKYPVAPDGIVVTDQLRKKAGVFHTEEDVLADVLSRLGMAPHARHPFAYLMEAADDISYCLSDIEDGIEKKICGWKDFKQRIESECESCSDEAKTLLERVFRESEGYRDVDPVVAFRTRLIRCLVEYSAEQYIENHDKILQGELPELISGDHAHGELLGCIKNAVRGLVYSSPLAQIPELTGLSVITGLLDIFEDLLLVDRARFESMVSGKWKGMGVDSEKRLYDLIARKHASAYRAAVNGSSSDGVERVLRIHMLLDFISGMTDSYSTSLFQTLRGIRA